MAPSSVDSAKQAPASLVKQAGIHSLDDSVMAQIFSLLSKQDRITCSLVSKKWCSITRTVLLQHRLYSTQVPRVLLLRGIAAWAQCIRSLDLTTAHLKEDPAYNYEYVTKVLTSVLSYCRSIRRLAFDHVDGATLRVLTMNAPQIESIILNCDPSGSLTQDNVNLAPLAICTELTELSVTSNGNNPLLVTNWDTLTHLRKLNSLTLSARIATDTATTAVAQCVNLTKLVCRGGDMTALTTLTRLSTLGCDGHHPPSDLSPWPVTEVVMWGGPGPNGLDFLATAPQLRALTLQGYMDMDFSGVSRCAELTRFALVTQSLAPRNMLPPSVNLDSLSGCTKLAHLHVSSVHLDSIAGLKSCTQLQDITLENSFKPLDLAVLTQCAQLTSICMSMCTAITEVRALSAVTSLKKFSLRKGMSVRDLSPLSSCVNLQEISILDCPNIMSVSFLYRLPELKCVKLGPKIDFSSDLAAITKHVKRNHGVVRLY